MLTNSNTSIALQAHDDPQDALWARFIAPVLSGDRVFMRMLEIPNVARAADLVPIDSIEGQADVKHGGIAVASTTHATVCVRTWRDRSAHVWACASSPEDLAKAVADITARSPQPEPKQSGVEIDFWQVAHAPYTTSTRIEAPEWADVAGNYPDEVWRELNRLRDIELTLDSGRIVLWHGPPGTGKTTAIRALARSWDGKVRTQVVLDPEIVFAKSSALMSVLLDEDTESPEKWRLLVIEDADEMLRSDAKERVGQALSRLLNLGDGLLGQGRRVAVLITTNEPIARLHPALTRPGRCLMETEFCRFDRAEASAFLGEPAPAGDSFSLAELSAIRRGEDCVAAEQQPAPGLYL